MTLVSYAAFVARYENTVPVADAERVQAFLDDAYALVTSIGGVDYLAGAEADIPAAVVAVVCAAVRRAYENPLGLAGESIGDYSWRGGAASENGVAFTKSEKGIIRRATGRLGVGTLTLTTYMPATPMDPTVSAYMSDGVVIVNAPEPEDV